MIDSVVIMYPLPTPVHQEAALFVVTPRFESFGYIESYYDFFHIHGFV